MPYTFENQEHIRKKIWVEPTAKTCNCTLQPRHQSYILPPGEYQREGNPAPFSKLVWTLLYNVVITTACTEKIQLIADTFLYEKRCCMLCTLISCTSFCEALQIIVQRIMFVDKNCRQ